MQGFLPPNLMSSTPLLPVANPAMPSARAAAPQGDNGFLRQLEQSRQRAQENARPAPQPAATKPAAAAAPPPAPPAKPQNKPPEASRTEAQRAAASRGPRKSDAPAKPESSTQDSGTESTGAKRADGDDTARALSDMPGTVTPPADPAAVPTDPALAQPSATGTPLPDALPPGLPRPPALANAALNGASEGAAVGGAPPAAGGAAAASASTLLLPAQGAGRDPREAAGKGSTEPGTWQQAQAAALAEGMGAAQEGAGLRQAEPHAATDAADRSLAPLGLAGPGSTGLHSAKAGEVAQASMAAPATSPEFRAALGAQVSFFARAGVQQAELHLNPADMGPVSIQIVLDGQQAQVNFGADSALTRQIIESGMPELAGALRDAGLTLTGGGVSQHAGGQRQDGNGHDSAGGNGSTVQSGTGSDGTTDAQVEQVRRSAVRVAQGGVDLYA